MWGREQQRLCPNCGMPKLECYSSFAPEAERDFQAFAPRCYACSAASKAMDGISDKAGLTAYVTRRR